MSWLFSRVLVEGFSQANCSAIESCAPSNGTPTPLAFSSDVKTMDFFGPSRYGTTCAPFAESLGEELLTWYQGAFRVKTSVVQELGQVLREPNRDYGASSPGWFAKLNLPAYEWKTPQISLLGDSELFSETWPRSGSMQSGVCYLRPPLAPTMIGSDSGSLLPTLTVNGNNNRPYPGKKSGYGLGTAVAMLPTLTTIGMNGGSNSRRATAKRGEPPTHIGPLNPVWCEWFMGFPLGWTASEVLETPKFHEWQQQHSIYSADKET